MIPFPVIIAHGALGYWDEVIFVAVAIVFLMMMVNSWIRSRDELPEETTAAASQPNPSQPLRVSEGHFELE